MNHWKILSVLNINHTAFPYLHVESNQDFSSDTELDQSRLKVEVKHSLGEDNQFSMFVKAYLDDDKTLNVPYHFEIVCLGEFSVEDGNLDCIKTKAFYLRNAAGVLFASIREMLALMTSRSPYITFMLPSYYFSLEQFLTEEEINSLD